MIRLRPWKKGDREMMKDWLLEERQFHMWSGGKFAYPLTVEQLKERDECTEWEERAWSMAALDDEGKLVGHFSFREVDYEKGSAHMGFIVIDPKRRGGGLGKEMVSQAVRYAFEILGLSRVTLNVMEENRAAYACYRSIGFQEERRSEGAYSFQGENWTVCLMAVEK